MSTKPIHDAYRVLPMSATIFAIGVIRPGRNCLHLPKTIE